MNHAHEPEDRDRGLAFDLSNLLSRRRLLSLTAAGVGAAVLAACGSDDDAAGTTPSAGSTAGSSAAMAADAGDVASCSEIPEETAGPYPGYGSNGPDVLAESGVVRSDIRASIGSASGVADGVPLGLDLTVVDTAAGCTPLAGAAVYVWHCDREGRYSMYSEGAESENYLRGVQETDRDGRVVFTSIFPACYTGRWPHVHFEVYASIADAIGGGEPIATSQLALPADTCDAVYATDGYEQSVSNLAQLSLETDMVFADGVEQQLATVAGNAQAGYSASLSVPV
jgi:protocatechuate 3,4-dioxygenase beta subunit